MSSTCWDYLMNKKQLIVPHSWMRRRRILFSWNRWYRICIRILHKSLTTKNKQICSGWYKGEGGSGHTIFLLWLLLLHSRLLSTHILELMMIYVQRYRLMGIINKRTFSRFSSFDIKCVCSRSIATLRLDNCMPFQLISAAAAAVVCPPNTYMIVLGVQRSAQPRTKKERKQLFCILDY